MFVDSSTQDCSRYYECVGTAAVLRQCEAGLYWDAREGACTWPEVSGCAMQFIKVPHVSAFMIPYGQSSAKLPVVMSSFLRYETTNNK